LDAPVLVFHFEESGLRHRRRKLEFECGAHIFKVAELSAQSLRCRLLVADLLLHELSLSRQTLKLHLQISGTVFVFELLHLQKSELLLLVEVLRLQVAVVAHLLGLGLGAQGHRTDLLVVGADLGTLVGLFKTHDLVKLGGGLVELCL